MYTNFEFLPRRPNPDGGDELGAENKNDYATVIDKFDAYFTRRDPQLLREKFWLHLKREPGQSFDAWVNVVQEKAAECKFPDTFREQAVRDKITFSCGDYSSKLKLYDQGATLNLKM